MATEIRTGYRKAGRKSRYYLGTLAIYEDGEMSYSYTGNVHRLTPEDAKQDAVIEAQSLAYQNPTVSIVIH